MQKLSETDRKAALQSLAQWHHDPDRDAITRTFKFSSFAEAFAFMTRVATLAEEANHHPEWSNTYSQVTILLTTHDANGLTKKDIALATQIDAI